MKRYWPFLLYAAAVVVHHVLLLVDPQFWTKGLLMSTLLAAVLLVGLVSDRGLVAGRRAVWMFCLLCAAIAFSWVGDMGLAISFEVGVAGFAASQLVYISLFAGPARSRSFPWWAIPYALLYTPVIAVLWTHLGTQSAIVAAYSLLLLATAVTSVVVGRVVAVGGLVFMVSEALLGLRMFMPDWLAWFPDPYQDTTIMLLYCIGQGLIAFGMMQRLEREPELAELRARRRSETVAAP